MRGKWIIDYLARWPGYLKYQLRIAKRPNSLIFVLTDRCNSMCIMCNFWKNKKKKEMTPAQIKGLLEHDLFRDLNNIALTGGEIFMRGDIPEIVDIIYETSGVKPTIGTNGLYYKKLGHLLATRKNKIGGIMISIEGIGEVHDKVRGKGTFDLTMKAIKIAKKHGFVPTLNMTLNKYNYDKLLETYEYFKDCVFTYKIAKKSKLHFGNNDDMDFELDREQIKKVLLDAEDIPKKNMYDIFLDDWALHNQRPLPCYAGLTSAVINPDGTLQPCLHKPSFGNVLKQSPGRIWNSKKSKRFRKKHRNCRQCYERCTVETFGIDLPKWVIKSKLKGYFNKE